MKEDLTMKSPFEILNTVNVNEHTEQKNGLTYLSWAWAWGELKKRFPDAAYTVYENRDGWNYHTDGRTAWVKTGVTVGGLEYVEMLPVMDFRNRSIPLEQITSTDVNKAIQRSLTKAVARHGLGLYIYAGEDLPEEAEQKKSRVVMVRDLCNELGITTQQFSGLRNTAVRGGVIPDIRAVELTDEDFASLMNFVRLNAAQSA